MFLQKKRESKIIIIINNNNNNDGIKYRLEKCEHCARAIKYEYRRFQKYIFMNNKIIMTIVSSS